MIESPEQVTLPSSLSRAWRFAWLSIALNLLPFVRTFKLTQTFGFPIPFAAYDNFEYSLAGINWVLLALNIGLLVAISILISKFQFARRILHIRVFLVVIIFSIACHVVWMNLILLIGLTFWAIPLGYIFGEEFVLPIYDTLSRLVVVAIITGVAYSVRGSESPKTT